MSERSEQTRKRILDATGRVLVRDGGNALTIASVAREAGISKGGLFHHFSSKELLVDGLIARYVATFDDLIATANGDPGAATRAYLRSAEHASGPATQPIIALLAAAVVDPRALVTLRERYRRWQDRLDDDGVPAHVSATVRFAVDGLWLADTLDLAPATSQTRKRIIKTLRGLLAGSDHAHGD